MKKTALLLLLILSGFGLKAQCTGEFSTFEVTCDSIEFTPVYYGPGVTYSWDFGDGETSSETIPAHQYDADGTYIVVLTVMDSIEGCSHSYTDLIGVDCSPCPLIGAAFASTPDSTGCGFTFVGTATGGTFPYTFSWDFGDGTTALGSSPYHVFSAGTWIVSMTATDADGCDTTIYESIDATCTSSSCDASFMIDTVACDSFVFLPMTTSATNYYWNFGDGESSTFIAPAHGYDADGTYPVILTVIDSLTGCSDTYTYMLEVDCDYPCTVVGDFAHFVDTTTCGVNFVATAFGGVGPYEFEWNFGDGSSGTGCCPTHYYVAGTYIPTLTIYDLGTGCDTSLFYTIVVDCDTVGSCNAGFDAYEVDCDSFYFEPLVPYGSSHFWDFGDGFSSTETFPFHTYATDGVYIVTHTVYDSISGCTDSYILTIDVDCDYPCTVVGDFVSYVDTTSCGVYFTATAFGGVGPYEYAWSFGDGTTGTGCCPTHYYPTGTWTPTLTITDLGTGCDTTVYDVVTVFCDSASYCSALFTIDDLYCDSIWFMPEMTSGVSHTWDFGDGYSSTDVFANHTYLADGVYIVTHTVYDSASGCFDSYTLTIDVDCDTPCDIVGTVYGWLDSTDCSVHLSAAATLGVGPYTYEWDFGDGTSATGCCPTHYYPSGIWTPTVTITDALGCTTTEYLTIDATCDTAVAPCNAYFTVSEIACDSFAFYPYSTGPATTHYWDFGDGFTSSATYPIHTYDSDGFYTIVHTVIDSATMSSCSYTYVIEVDCDYPCTVTGDFAWYLDSTDCSVTFTSTAFGGTAPYTYLWNFGDGTTSTSCCPTHYYSPGTWTPTLTITDADGCDTTIYDVVYVDCDTSFCVATFTTSSLGCNTIQFYGLASPSSVFYSWDFGDGTTSFDMNPIHTFADGTYMVTLTTYDSLTGCTASYWDYFVIDCDSVDCSALFTYYYAGCDSVYFVPVGGGAGTSYLWDFGDGSTSTEMSPTHVFDDADSIYYVVLTVTDSTTGCYDVYTGVIVIDCGTLSIDEETAIDVLLYPNPSTGIVNIQSETDVDYSVISADGKLIFESNTAFDKQIDLTEFSNGMYYVRIVQENQVLTKPIVKQ